MVTTTLLPIGRLLTDNSSIVSNESLAKINGLILSAGNDAKLDLNLFFKEWSRLEILSDRNDAKRLKFIEESDRIVQSILKLQTDLTNWEGDVQEKRFGVQLHNTLLTAKSEEINDIDEARAVFGQISRYGKTSITMLDEDGERERLIFQ